MSKYNEELAQATLDFIEENPHLHNQTNYICNTSACIAGTAALLSELKSDEIKDIFANYDAPSQAEISGEPYVGADKLLGLNAQEAEFIFYDMSEKRAIEKLRYVANGKDLTEHEEWKEVSW